MSKYDISTEANLDLMNRKPWNLCDGGAHGALLMPVPGVRGTEAIGLIGQAATLASASCLSSEHKMLKIGTLGTAGLKPPNSCHPQQNILLSMTLFLRHFASEYVTLTDAWGMFQGVCVRSSSPVASAFVIRPTG